MSADPTPLSDEEIAELERQDHAPDRRLLATIRDLQRQQLATKAHLRRTHHCEGGMPGHDAPAWRQELDHLEAVERLAGILDVAVARWEHKRFGDVDPLAATASSEESGILGAVGVLHDALNRSRAADKPGSRDREEQS